MPGRCLLTSSHSSQFAAGARFAAETMAPLIWSLAPPAERQVEMDHHWRNLGNIYGAAAYRSMWAMAAEPQRSVAFLHEQLKPAVSFPANTVANLVTDLSLPRPAVRTAAYGKLQDAIFERDGVEAEIRKALPASSAVEAARRMRVLLQLRNSGETPPNPSRTTRAIIVLEWAGTPEARGVLKALVAGDAGAFQTQLARAELVRLKR